MGRMGPIGGHNLLSLSESSWEEANERCEATALRRDRTVLSCDSGTLRLRTVLGLLRATLGTVSARAARSPGLGAQSQAGHPDSFILSLGQGPENTQEV
jgi:hypothetical protein